MRLRTTLYAIVGALLCIGLVSLGASGALPPSSWPAAIASGATPEPLPLPAPPGAVTAVAPPGTDPTTTKAAPAPTRTRPPPPLPTQAPLQRPALQQGLADLLVDPDLPEDEQLGVSVIDERGYQVFGHRRHEPMLPASTQKLVAAAGALALFGPEHRFTTEVAATAPVGPEGLLDGDLVLVGGGDPVLATPQFGQQVNSERPRTPMEALADALVAKGLRRLTGQVVGDPTVLPHDPIPEGWIDRYISGGHGTPSAGLTVDGGRRLFIEDGRLASVVAEDPATQAAAALHGLLVERGVVIDLQPVASREPPAATTVLARVQSPPLSELLRHTVQRSDNHLADTLFRMTGLAAGGSGTWESAAAGMPEALDVLGLDWAGMVLADGSGLSRADRLTAAFLTALDLRMTQSNFGGQWQDLMAVAGESGTLRGRLRGTIADGRMLGKTGSLSDVRSLSGTVLGPEGSRYHFAVVGNDLEGSEDTAVRELQDELVLVLTENLYGCVRLPPLPVPTPTATDHTPPPTPPDGYELPCDAA